MRNGVELTVDWSQYRSLCDRPDVLTRWTLERAVALLEQAAGQVVDDGPDTPALASLRAGVRTLRSVLAAEPLPRPLDYVGPAATHAFVARLEPALVRQILAIIERAGEDGWLLDVLGQRSPVGYLAAWREYADFMAAAAGRPAADAQ